MSKKKKGKFWIYQDPFVCLPYFFLRSNAYRNLSNSARSLYTVMRMAVNGQNKDPTKLPFGPSDAKLLIPRRTYYKAMREILTEEIILEVSSGGHGIKAVYDLTTSNWTSRPLKERKTKKKKT